MPQRDIILVGANADLFEAQDDEVLLCGPAGTGKTLACFWRLHHDLLKFPGLRALYLRKTRASCTQSGLVTYEEQILPPGSKICAGAGRANRHTYTYPNGSVLVVGGLDKPTRLFSTEWGRIYVQEANELREEEWVSLGRGLRHPVGGNQQLIADCNPDHPRHWLKIRCDAGQTRLITGVHRDNPAYFDPITGEPTKRGLDYLQKLGRLTGVMAERLCYGRWAAAEGAVYEGWTDEHLIDRFVIPDDWRRICSIDFGYTNPFTCQWWAVDPDGRLYLYREIYGVKRLTSDWVAMVKALSEGEKIDAFVADHDSGDRAIFQSGGITTTKAIKPVKTGIEAVCKRLQRQPDGKFRLYILRDSLVSRDEELAAARQPCSVIEEIPAYCWPKGVDIKPVKELPAPGPDHGCDAQRYAVAHFDLRRTAKVY